MFRLDTSATYKWPVTITVPADGGIYEKHEFTAVFRRLKLSEVDKVKAMSIKDCAKEVIAGWEGVQDDSGNEIAFSAKSLNELLDIPGFAFAVIRDFFTSVAGAPEKN